MAKKEEPKIVAENELERKIMEAFEVFDHSGKQSVDVREIGTVLRSLGCCPTEEEVQQVITETENKEATGSIPLANFLPYMVNAIIQHKFYPANAEQLLEAFRYFDTEGRGYLAKDRFIKLMMEEGEPFMQEDVNRSTKEPVRAAVLRSFLSQRVASGHTTQSDPTKVGEYFVELRVYNTREVERVAANERWKSAVLCLKLGTNTDTRFWKALHQTVLAGRDELKHVQPILFPNNIF